MDKSTLIMIVTPYRDISELIRHVLRELGFHDAIVVTDVDVALERLREDPTYGLVIADWTMEPRGGLALLQQMRADEKLKPVRFIMMSGMPKKATIVAAKAAGVDNFIAKPFSTATLKRKLAAVLGAA